jgi:hypothetical protein
MTLNPYAVATREAAAARDLVEAARLRRDALVRAADGQYAIVVAAAYQLADQAIYSAYATYIRMQGEAARARVRALAASGRA